MASDSEYIRALSTKYIEGFTNYCISVEQTCYIADGISYLCPKKFLEIGTCTGTSAGYVANIMHRNNG